MKVLFVDNGTTGHHKPYESAISRSCDESVFFIPEDVNISHSIIYVSKYSYKYGDSIVKLYKWINEIRNIAKKEKVDIIHFLEGDVLYSTFGIGLALLKDYKIVTTIHKIYLKYIYKIRFKCISKFSDYVVVHSDYLKKLCESLNINNIVVIEYPRFNQLKYTRDESRNYFSLEKGIKVIACIGATRYDKGLDILLKALNSVSTPFQLLIAGRQADIGEKLIKDLAENYIDRVHLCMHFLTDEELAKAFYAADIICLPYRKIFNGASGPLGEGVALERCIVGPNSLNLGETITKNELGFVFEAEDERSLSEIINKALKNDFIPSQKYIEYKNKLTPCFFVDKYRELYEKCVD